ADLADSGLALNRDHAHLARWHAKRGVLSFTGYELCAGTCGSGQLAPLARTHLYIVYYGAERQVCKLQTIAGFYIGFRTGHDLVADLEPYRGENVALLTIAIVEQGNMGRAVGVVFDSRYLGRNIFLIALEVYYAIAPLVAASALPCGNSAHIVAAARFAQGFQQALLRPVGRYLLKGGIRLKPAAGGRRLHCP